MAVQQKMEVLHLASFFLDFVHALRQIRKDATSLHDEMVFGFVYERNATK